jgi:RNA polymerase sigma-70 factor (ECF subfamily)
MFDKKQQYQDFYKEVFEKHSQFIFSHILSKVGKRNDALDIAQDVMVHLWKYRKDLKADNTEAILYKSCQQEIFHFYKNQKNKGESVSMDALEIQIMDHSQEELEEKMEKERLLDSLYETLNLVPARRKEIFLLNKIEGKTREEIAVEMNMSKSAIGNQIDKTMRFLKNKFTPKA